jgi:hypothetical protein
VDRANLSELAPGEAPVRIAWAAAGMEPPEQTMEAVRFPWTAARLEGGDVVHFAHLDELPEEAAVDRQSYQKTGTRSHLSLPLRAGGPMLGVLSFDSVRAERVWPRSWCSDSSSWRRVRQRPSASADVSSPSGCR